MRYDGARWGASRTEAVGGRVVKVYAEQLDGPGVVSANLYLAGAADAPRADLRPCEMPAEVVLAFLRGLTLAVDASADGSSLDNT